MHKKKTKSDISHLITFKLFIDYYILEFINFMMLKTQKIGIFLYKFSFELFKRNTIYFYSDNAQ